MLHTSKDASNPGAESAPALNAKGYPVALPAGQPHYDYANQCWIDATGLVAACGHQGNDPVCHACRYAGTVHTCQGECA